MAFGGSGGFTFGSNNNQSSGFGGFGGGSNTTNTGGFGSQTSNTGTGFGSSTAQSNPFGGGGGGGGGGGNAFGSTSNTGGFGTTSNTGGSSLFGNKPSSGGLFGASTSTPSGGGLFGNNTQSNTGGGFGSSSGGFGSTANNNAFGSNSSGFGSGFSSANKPAFGSSSSSTPLFGQGGAGTTTGFGSTGAFGSAGAGTALSNQPVPPSEGTAAVPFSVTTEKEGNGQNSYHTITFQQPYQKYSLEELRLADYNAGRRFGNGGGQAGAFGASNFGFGAGSTGGGFGASTNSNPFGQNASSSGGLGSNTSTAFGASNPGGGLFSNKPASGGLFGNQPSGTSSGGSLFGTSNNTTTPSNNPFGAGSSSGFGSSNTGGGLFSSSQNQSKPSLFGNAATSNNSTGFSFGNNAASNTGSTGGIFGNNNNQQQQQSSGGLFSGTSFGGANNQQKPNSLFSGTGSGTGFGSTSGQAQNSGGLFNTSNNNTTGGSPFPGNQQQSSGGGLFNTSVNTGGGLFSNQNNAANKPGGLFSGSTFGTNNQQQQPTGGGLFGGQNNNANPSGGGLFGASSNQPSNSFSFPGSNQNQNKPSLWGNTSSNQSGGMFGGQNNGSSMFGGSMSQPQQNQQQQEFKHSSLLDPNPYGQSSIWTGLPTPNMENSKPLVTPLVATQKLKESQAKPPPNLRLNQSRYMTPPRRPGTYGFTYSTYGTPNSAASTPGGNGLSNSMYMSRFSGGSFGRSMGKAASVSNLRSQYTDGESVLTPGAFAPSASRYSSGSIRRLHIDRSIKNDLFTRPPLPALTAPPQAYNGLSSSEPAPSTNSLDSGPEPNQKLKKRVSFDRDTTGGQSNSDLNGQTGALVRTEVDDEDSPQQDRGPTKAVNGADQSRGNELASVPEDRESEGLLSKKPATSHPVSLEDPKPGDYWMKPTRAEMKKMSQAQLKHYVGFEVGRHGAGQVRFDEPVDLTNVPLDELFVTIVEIHARSVTVYPDASTKPPPGKGLNVPSTITIENSWPRAKGKPTSVKTGPLFEKHLKRLRNITGTHFIDYDADTGVWIFKVPHYTRYGLDYEDDDMDDDSELSAPPDSINQYKTADMSVMEIDSDDESSPGNDTFSFKQKTVPGGFGRQAMIDDEPDHSLVRSIEQDHDGSDHSAMSEDDASDSDMELAGAYPEPTGPILDFESPSKPILKPAGFGTPGKAILDLDGDWAEQLQRTISPRKQNREALREAQNKILLDRAYEPIKPKSAAQKKDFRTSLDVMAAIFDKPERRNRGGKAGKAQGQAEPDFEYPYAKRAKIFDSNEHEMSEAEQMWHASFKPNFTTDGSLICKTSPTPGDDAQWERELLLRDDDVAITKTSLKTQPRLDITAVLAHATLSVEKGSKIPTISYAKNIPFSVMRASLPPNLRTDEITRLFDLLHVLFDEYEDEISLDLSPSQKQEFDERIRRDRLSLFLEKTLANKDTENIAAAEKSNSLEAAVRLLAKHDVKGASELLMKSRNFHLALLVAQIDDADDGFQGDMRRQIEAWRSQNMLSEMSDDVRSLYELLAGNTGVCTGKADGAVEDRASTFSISEKYSLDWVQAFALNFWYGKVKNGTIGECVADFQEKLELKEEKASPVLADGVEDPLWIVLKLFDSMNADSRIGSPVLPQALSALEGMWDASAAFHVFQCITATLSGEDLHVDKGKADDLTEAFAAQLEAKGDVVGATFALLHLSDANKRKAMLQDLLNRHAATLPSLDHESLRAHPDGILSLLTKTLLVPVEMLAKAKALFARSTFDAQAELKYLMIAGEKEEAHQCLCQRVAPRLVIDEDYDGLKDAIMQFGDAAGQGIWGWDEGGDVYAGFALLVGMDGKKSSQKEKAARLEGCKRGLQAMGKKFQGKSLGEGGLEQLEERVAVREMARAVAEIMDNDAEKGGDLASEKAILDLPLTADARMNQARKMGAEYYQRLMATAR